MTKLRPFDFAEFRAAPSTAAAEPRNCAFSADDLDVARAQGVIEGRRLAMETIAADEAAALHRIGDRLSESADEMASEIARIRADIVGMARVFLEEYSAADAAAHDLEAAADLLRRLTENSEDRRAARLVISAKRLDRLRDRLEELINNRGIGDFVSLESDAGLEAGEARLEWRGGETRRSRAEVKAAIAALFNSEDLQ